MVWPLIGAAAGLAGSLIGGASASANAKAAAKAQDKYNKEKYKFDWRQTKREYNYRKQEVGIQRQNQEQQLGYSEETSKRNYLQDLAIRDFEYGNQVRAFNQSEKIYGLQRGFNAKADQLAKNAEARRYQEITTGMAFEQQDMLVKMLQEEGMARVTGGSGRSAAKSLGSVMASYGRNQAIMAESLLSATRDSQANLQQIEQDRFSADLAAESRRMLQPLLAPKPMAPLKMPRAILLDPLKPEKPPKPVASAAYAGSNGGLAIALNAVNTGLSTYLGLGGTF